MPIDTSWTNQNTLARFNNIQTQKSVLATEITDYIDDVFALGYSKSACRRDTGFIIDALIYDLTYGGNLETYNAALAYFVGGSAQYGVGEKQMTLAALDRLNDVVVDVANAVAVTASSGNTTVQDQTLPAGPNGAIFAGDRIQEIIYVINNDGSVYPAKIIPDNSWVSAEFIDAFNSLINNDDTIASGVTELVNNITGNQLGSFIDAQYRIKNYIINYLSPNTEELTMLDALFDDIIIETLVNPTTIVFGSLIESIGHQFNLAGAGVNRNALPLNFRRVGTPLAASGSVLQEDGGRVRWSGADELNNQYFAKGLKINGQTGKLEGRPFTSSVRRLARRAANSRIFT
jgi:hypothetical protein